MHTPDELHRLDLQIFASASGMTITHLAHDWRASLTIDGHELAGYGPRPWMATAALYRQVIDRDHVRSNTEVRGG